MTITVKAELVRLVFQNAVFFWDLYNCMRWSCLSPSSLWFQCFLALISSNASTVGVASCVLFVLFAEYYLLYPFKYYDTMVSPACKHMFGVKFVFVASTAVFLFVDIDAW